MKIEIDGVDITSFGGIIGDATVIIHGLTIQQEDLDRLVSTMVKVGVEASQAPTSAQTRVKFTELIIIPADAPEDIEIMCMVGKEEDLEDPREQGHDSVRHRPAYHYVNEKPKDNER